MADAPRVNIIYVRRTVARLLPFLENLLAHTTWSFRAVANGCTPTEVALLRDARRRVGDRLEVRVVSDDTVLLHGDAIARLLADETSPYFCCIDSDIFAVRPIEFDELLPAEGEVATCSCLPMWRVERDDVMPEGFDVASGRFLRSAAGEFLGCTYAFCYRTAELRETVERWGLPLTPCEWVDLSVEVRNELDARGLRRKTYDTMTVANILLQRSGRPMVYRDIPGLLHLGAQSSLNEDVSWLRRPIRHVAWRWFPWAFAVLWRARGRSGAESASVADFARRRAEAVRLADALAAGRADFANAPSWVGGREVFDTLRQLLGPGEAMEQATATRDVEHAVGSRPLTVLHVTEAFGGGIVSSIAELIARTPDVEHHLLCTVRSIDHTAGEGVEGSTSVEELPVGLIRAVVAIRRSVRGLRPDVVHAHSSYGGLYARLAVDSRRTRVVYTPQGYGFLRTDVSRLHRRAIREVERLLTWNTSALAACSVHEASLGLMGRRRMERHVVPNVVLIGRELSNHHEGNRRPHVLVACGRLQPIRDPGYFLRVVGEVRRQHPEVCARWLGGHEGRTADQLRAAGIEVTGWLPRPELLTQLAEASVYVHTSGWDGFPMTVLEAVSLGVPTVARRIPQLEECPQTVLFDSEAALGEAIAALLAFPMSAAEHEALWRSFLAAHSPEVQRERLLAAYGVTSSRFCSTAD